MSACDGPPTAGHAAEVAHSGAVFPLGVDTDLFSVLWLHVRLFSHHFWTAAQLLNHIRWLISTCAGLMITSMSAFVAAVAN